MEQFHEVIFLSFDDVMFRFCLCQLALEQCKKKRFLKLRDHDFSQGGGVPLDVAHFAHKEVICAQFQ